MWWRWTPRPGSRSPPADWTGPTPSPTAGSGPAARGPTCGPISPSRLEADQPEFGHLLDGVRRALPGVSGVLHPAVRLLVGPGGGHVVDQHPAELQCPGGLQRLAEVAGEDAGLQAVAR